jgi:hypothetical protein
MASPSVYELSSKNGINSVVSASNGTFILNNTSRYGGVIKAIVVLEKTKFNFIKETGNPDDLKAIYIANTGIDLQPGAMITPLNQNTFSEVRLESGSVAVIL